MSKKKKKKLIRFDYRYLETSLRFTKGNLENLTDPEKTISDSDSKK